RRTRTRDRERGGARDGGGSEGDSAHTRAPYGPLGGTSGCAPASMSTERETRIAERGTAMEARAQDSKVADQFRVPTSAFRAWGWCDTHRCFHPQRKARVAGGRSR